MPKMKTINFYNLLLEETSHHFWYVLFVKDASVNPVHTQGAGVIQGHEYDEKAGIITSHLTGCLLQFPNKVTSGDTLPPE